MPHHLIIVLSQPLILKRVLKRLDVEQILKCCSLYQGIFNACKILKGEIVINDEVILKVLKNPERKVLELLLKLDLKNLKVINSNKILTDASKGWHLEIVKYAESNGINDWNRALWAVSEGGHLEIIQYAESKGADYWNDALWGASRGGHMEIVKYMESKGTTHWNWALYGAAEGGHMEIVKYAESKGANNWNLALYGASRGGNMEIVKYAESKGANIANYTIRNDAV